MFPYFDKENRIPVYGVLFFMGILVSALVLFFLNKKDKNRYWDIRLASCFGRIGAFLGAKLLFILTALPVIRANHISWIVLLRSGFVFYGGLIGGAFGYLVYCLIYKIDFISRMDSVAIVVPLGQCFGRIGCFAAGCCYGRPTDSIIGVVYTHPADRNTPVGVKLLPIQLFESACCLLLFFFLLFLFFRKSIRKGTLCLMYLLCYCSFRFIIEFYRYDAIRGNFGMFSTSQIISLVLLRIVLFSLLIDKIKQLRMLKK